jgi:hypothetical protein
LTAQLKKANEVRAEVLAQYTLTLEVDQFLELIKKLESN